MMNNEPVAFWNKDFDLWEENAIQTYKADGWNIPLYTHPVKELKNIVVASATCSCGKVMEVTNLQPVKELTPCEELRAFQEQQNGVFSEHNACCYRHECRIVWNDREEIRSNPVKELTDEEILAISNENYIENKGGDIEFARAILRKAWD